MKAQLWKMFCKISMNTCATILVTLLCWFAYLEALLDSEGWLEKMSATFIGKHACNFIKKWLQHRCFPLNFAKLSRTPFCKTSANGWFWTPLMKVEPYPSSIRYAKNLIQKTFNLSMLFSCFGMLFPV